MENELIRRYDVLGKAQWIGSQTTVDDLWPEGKEAVTVEDIEAIPAVDAVEVVRCRECRYFCKGENDSESWEWCDCWKKDCWEDCYCACGKRREDGDA